MNQIIDKVSSPNRAFNFSAGPSMLPDSVLLKAQSELLDYQGSGMSIMEVSHRGGLFSSVQQQLEADLTELLDIPEGYRILLMHGGSQSQFSMIPLNFSNGVGAPVYIETGHWGRTAIKAAKQYVDPSVIQQLQTVTAPASGWQVPKDAAYTYYVDNETVNGIEFVAPVDVDDVPTIVDMSSNFLSRPIDLPDYGMVFACAQKNLGIAGVTVVVVSEALLDRVPLAITPPLYNYNEVLSKQSVPNTPATFSWYMMALVLQWIKAEGGLAVMDQRAQQRAALLYDFIDQSSLYTAAVEKASRSRMNINFSLNNQELEKLFLNQAELSGLTHLKGHKSVGGCRASLYNSMPMSGVEALVTFMQDFENRA